MLPRSTPLAAGRLIAVRMHNTRIGSGVQSHIICEGLAGRQGERSQKSQTRNRTNSNNNCLKFRAVYSDIILSMDLEELPFLSPDVGCRNLLNKLICIKKLNYLTSNIGRW